MMEKIKTRLCSVDIFRLFCAVLVIAIHTYPLADIAPAAAYFIKQELSTVAVPYFFALAGYFYIQKLRRGEKAFLPYIKKIILLYFLWSLIYYAADFVLYGYKEPVGYTIGFWLRFPYNGSYYHFWFFPALIYAVCICTLLFRLRLGKLVLPLGILFHMAGCLCFSYHGIAQRLPFMSRFLALPQIEVIREIFFMGFPLFVSGYLAYLLKERLQKVSDGKMLGIWLASAFMWLGEMFLVGKAGWQLNFEVTVFLYPMTVCTILLLLKHPMPQHKTAAEYCRAAANFGYYVHPLVILCLQQMFSGKLTETPVFILTTFISLGLGAAVRKLNNRYLNILIS